MIKKLSDEPIAELQKEQAKNWYDDKLLDKCVASREGMPSYVFYEGPPTANGKPGIHHVIARTLKDSVCRYKTMTGYQVKRKAGWDTHGLPVEIEVEKQLGMEGKQDIEEYGIEPFNKKCRESVFTYESQWRDMTERMGYLIDLDNPYITLENEYIESIWWILKEFFKSDMIYQGHKIIPYCSRCGTGLASHEVAQGYKEVKVNTVTVKFKKSDSENEYFLAWTTTPWTLAANASLTVGTDLDYVKVKMLSGDEAGNIFYIAKALHGQVLGEVKYEVIDEMKGEDLEYTEYDQLMPFVKTEKKAFFVTCMDYVSTEDGTGIVHTAPAFGEDDYNCGLKYDLPVIQPVDEEGKYTDTPWKNRFVMDADLEIDIIKYLARENKVYSKIRMEHNYPHCWRCETPLLYYAKPSWYIKMTALKDSLVSNNNEVNWFPYYVGEKRFGNWLENVNDWAISRDRYWGTPIPIWMCECGHKECIGSRQELFEKSEQTIGEDIELHRPYVDDIHIECPDCGKAMNRIPEVIDCWFDSGAMPFAQHHYPFENEAKFDEELFPADFICEGIDQTRGWFYSLMAISTFIKGKAPYRNVLVNDLILDKNGKKMSKHKGNTVDPFELFDKYGADATRWYLLHASPAWAPTKFDEDGLAEIVSKFFGTLRNVYSFFVLYSNQDKTEPEKIKVPYGKRPEIDIWIISLYNRLIREVREEMERYDHMKAVRKIQNFVSEDLSNWYIRRARRRFWAEELNEDKKSVYATTYEILTGIAQLSAPFAPFISDEIYKNLTGEESVHLSFFPESKEDLIDPDIENRMDIVRTITALGRGIRDKEKIKVRQPLESIMIDGKYEGEIGELVSLIKEELNVKKVIFENHLDKFMEFSLKPNFKVAGPKLGKSIKSFASELENRDPAEFIYQMNEGGSVCIDLDGRETDITRDMIDVRISAKEGFSVAMENNIFVVLDTKVTKELYREGIARELISKVQQMRKKNDYEMMDRIRIYLDGDEDVNESFDEHRDHIMKETLGDEIVKEKSEATVDINGHSTGLRIERI